MSCWISNPWNSPCLHDAAFHFLPAFRMIARFQRVKVDHVLCDGDKVTLGGVTALHTPGHTRGATTFLMPKK